MKFDQRLLKKCYHDTMIQQYKRELEKQGFTVYLEYNFYGFLADLYAEKNSEKRVYEFKLVGSGKFVNGKLTKFKETVEANGAIPYVVYVNPPAEKTIEFDNLDRILTSYFVHNDLPEELDELSTHTRIEFIEVDDLTSLIIHDDYTIAEGKATISVELQYGSDSDVKDERGYSDEYSFPMTFNVKLENCNGSSIISADYNIDTSDFY